MATFSIVEHLDVLEQIGACLVPVVIEETGHPVVQDPAAPVCAPDGGR